MTNWTWKRVSDVDFDVKIVKKVKNVPGPNLRLCPNGRESLACSGKPHEGCYLRHTSVLLSEI